MLILIVSVHFVNEYGINYFNKYYVLGGIPHTIYTFNPQRFFFTYIVNFVRCIPMFPKSNTFGRELSVVAHTSNLSRIVTSLRCVWATK